ncbi:MAG: hypothetical protein IIX70_01000 [Oscillospiraceae bacterium]|nr:hypothetical protein [Oscillospiraceae bacterium]
MTQKVEPFSGGNRYCHVFGQAGGNRPGSLSGICNRLCKTGEKTSGATVAMLTSPVGAFQIYLHMGQGLDQAQTAKVGTGSFGAENK